MWELLSYTPVPSLTCCLRSLKAGRVPPFLTLSAFTGISLADFQFGILKRKVNVKRVFSAAALPNLCLPPFPEIISGQSPFSVLLNLRLSRIKYANSLFGISNYAYRDPCLIWTQSSFEWRPSCCYSNSSFKATHRVLIEPQQPVLSVGKRLLQPLQERRRR